MLVERVEPTLPEAAVALDPLRRFAHRTRDQPKLVHAAAFLAGDEADRLEDPQVLRDRRQRDFERRRQLSDASAAVGEAGDDRPPGGIGEGGEDRVERVRLSVNHMVNIRDEKNARQAGRGGPLDARCSHVQSPSMPRSSAMSGRNDGRSWRAARYLANLGQRAVSIP